MNSILFSGKNLSVKIFKFFFSHVGNLNELTKFWVTHQKSLAFVWSNWTSTSAEWLLTIVMLRSHGVLVTTSPKLIVFGWSEIMWSSLGFNFAQWELTLFKQRVNFEHMKCTESQVRSQDNKSYSKLALNLQKKLYTVWFLEIQIKLKIH